MLRRLAAPLPLLAILSLALVGPALGKEGMQARLDAPIPADTPPGTTIEVGWTTFQADDAGGRIVAFSGAPVFIALRSPGATEPEAVVFGEEFPSGSGHFTASIVVPAGGIAPDGVTIGLRGESCQDGACQRSDLPFELVGEVLTTAVVVPPVAASAAPGVVDAPGSTAASSDPAGDADATPWPAILAIGALVVGGGLIAMRVGRRRAAAVVTGALAAGMLLG